MATTKSSGFALELYELEKQYIQVEKETHKLEAEILNSSKRKSRLESEVRFFRKKLKTFRIAEQERPLNTAAQEESDDISEDSDLDQHTKVDSPVPGSGMSPNTRARYLAGQFHEVEVKLASIRTLEDGSFKASPIRIESPVDYESDSSLRKYAGKGKVSWHEEGYAL